MLIPDKLRSAVTATGGAGEAELAGPVWALREAGARSELVSVKPGQLRAVRHDLQPAQTFATGNTFAVPEPSGIVIAGLVGAAGLRRRRRA